MRASAYGIIASQITLALVLLAPRDAHALGPVDVEVAGTAGFGTNVNGGPGPNPLSAGFGARTGVSVFGAYAGFNFIDYLGGSGTPPGRQGSFSIHELQVGGQVGYGFKIGFVTIRPQLGFGDAIFSSAGSSLGSFYLEPGGLVQLGFGHLIVGVDAGCLILTSQDTVGAFTNDATIGKAFTMHGQVGARF